MYHRFAATDHLMPVPRPVTEQPERFCTVRTRLIGRPSRCIIASIFHATLGHANREIPVEFAVENDSRCSLPFEWQRAAAWAPMRSNAFQCVPMRAGGGAFAVIIQSGDSVSLFPKLSTGGGSYGYLAREKCFSKCCRSL